MCPEHDFNICLLHEVLLLLFYGKCEILVNLCLLVGSKLILLIILKYKLKPLTEYLIIGIVLSSGSSFSPQWHEWVITDYMILCKTYVLFNVVIVSGHMPIPCKLILRK